MHFAKGQVAVVTGAASGLGFALAEAYAQRGLDVVLADVEAGPLREATAAIDALGVAALGVRTDVRSPSEVDGLAATTIERFGRVDVVCNNAGVTTLGLAWETSLEDWDWVLSVNLGGVINGIRAFVPHLVAQNSGHIVNTASMAGLSNAPWHGPYVASKHAVVGLTESLAFELSLVAPGVGATVVCPGVVETRIQDASRNRPSGDNGLTADLSEAEMKAVIEWGSSISGPMMTAADAAAIILRAVEDNRVHVAPNGTLAGAQARVDHLLADLRAT
ncbi:MAG TPA: SDR family NAD(P)-dependent oxidoreductase [Acidimicrobiales bacterium]